MNSVLPAEIAARLALLPPAIKITQIAEVFQKKVPTLRKQIRLGAFPVTVDQAANGIQFVSLANLLKFYQDGKIQPQPPRPQARVQNPFGRRGRPSHASKKTSSIKINQAK